MADLFPGFRQPELNLPSVLQPALLDIPDADNKFNINSVSPFIGAGLGVLGLTLGLGNTSTIPFVDPDPVLGRIRRMQRAEKATAAQSALRRLGAAGIANTGLAQRVIKDAEAMIDRKYQDIISNVLAQIEIQNQQLKAQRDMFQAQQKQDIFSGIANTGLSLLAMALI